MWHPDKLLNDQNKDEATERFRRIAEAYQALSDPEQKAMYDQYLQSSSLSSSSTEERSFFSWETFRDPLKVFEEFFFAQDDNNDDEKDWGHGRGSATTNNNPTIHSHQSADTVAWNWRLPEKIVFAVWKPIRQIADSPVTTNPAKLGPRIAGPTSGYGVSVVRVFFFTPPAALVSSQGTKPAT